MEIIYQPADSDRLGDYLKRNMSEDWLEFRAAVAFVKRSGTKHLVQHISNFARIGKIEIIAGVDHQGTSAEGLRDLLHAVEPNGRIVVFHNLSPSTFHPKIYLFKREDAAEILIGSGNLTEGGLFTNCEMSVRLRIDLTDLDQAAFLQSLERVLDEWCDTSSETAEILDHDLLERLVSIGLVPLEAKMVPGRQLSPPLAESSEETEVPTGRIELDSLASLFAARPVRRAPTVPKSTLAELRVRDPSSEFAAAPMFTLHSVTPAITHFVMTLQKTDVGVGQVTSGASKRSPEIFVPLSARDAAPDFWDWPYAFGEDSTRQGKFDRLGVRVRLGTNVVSVNMMTWPVKHDFRLRSEALRSAGTIGDILHLEKVDPDVGFDYFAEVVPRRTSQYSAFLALCSETVRNSKKTYGYY